MLDDMQLHSSKTQPGPKIMRSGLTMAEVHARHSRGQNNKIEMPQSKTIGQIIADHVLTPFILLNLIIFTLILLTGRLINALFMGVVIANILIGIIQEIRAKRVLDRLSVLTAVQASVIRDGLEQQIPLDKMVLDDLFILRPGSQVGADGLILESDQLEVDESLLTGEVEPVRKTAGDQVLSGSYAVAGQAVVQVIHVGQDNYAQKITIAARRYKKAHSEILDTMNRIIRIISIFILPVGLLLFASQFFRQRMTWQDAVVGSAAGMIGMIPEGLILLTSMTLAAGIIRLTRRRAVVQDLPGIEVLARVNVLCLDKTGTLTTGSLHLTEVIPLGAAAGQDIVNAVAATVAAFTEKNSTALALAEHFPDNPGWPVSSKVPFSSYRRWSGVSFAAQGTWMIGAPEILIGPEYREAGKMAGQYAASGARVVVLARSSVRLAAENLPADIQPVALLLLAEVVRPEARAAISHFLENDVTVKILSGDHAATVADIAGKLGLPDTDRYVDASGLADNPAELIAYAQHYTIFGRVTPLMKQKLIRAMKDQGHIVAMAGDGVNDVLALREADCGIALASGSEAAKNTAHIILLDSDFTALPAVVREGRQVINNIERVSSLFLAKTTYSTLLSAFFILLGLPYPFFPIHKTLIGSTSIGIPAFFLALEKNSRRIHPGFLHRILRQAIPGGLCVTAGILVVRLLQPYLGVDSGQVRTMTVAVTGLISQVILIRIASPLNLQRIVLVLAMTGLFCFEMIFFGSWLDLVPISFPAILVVLAIGLIAALILFMVARFLRKGVSESSILW